MAVELRPLVHEMRLHAERAITLLAQARAAGPLRETDAIDAMELGARKLDFIGQKFETADTIASLYNEAYSGQSDSQKAKLISGMLGTISGANGVRLEIQGTGFTFTNGQLSGGQVSSLEFSDVTSGGATVLHMTVNGAGFNAAALVPLLNADNTTGLFTTVLAIDKTNPAKIYLSQLPSSTGSGSTA